MSDRRAPAYFVTTSTAHDGTCDTYINGPGLPARAFSTWTEQQRREVCAALNVAHRAGARAVRTAMLDALGLATWGRDVSVKEGA